MGEALTNVLGLRIPGRGASKTIEIADFRRIKAFRGLSATSIVHVGGQTP